MKRPLFTFLSVLSLLVCAALLVLWSDSCIHNRELLRLSPGPQYYALRSANGQLILCHTAPQSPLPLPTTRPAGAVLVPTFIAAQLLTVPHWALIGFLLIIPAIIYGCHRYWNHLPSRPVRPLRPLTRRLLATLACLSLLLHLTTTAFWIHSYLRPSLACLFRPTNPSGIGTTCIIGSGQGQFHFNFHHTRLSLSANPPGTWALRPGPRSETSLPGLTINTLQILATKRQPASTQPVTPPLPNPPILFESTRSFHVAFWLPFTLFLILPLLWLFHFLRQRP